MWVDTLVHHRQLCFAPTLHSNCYMYGPGKLKAPDTRLFAMLFGWNIGKWKHVDEFLSGFHSILLSLDTSIDCWLYMPNRA